MRFFASGFLRSWRGMAAIAALVLILFLWRPGVYRLRARIAASIGSALGRRVELDNVSLRFLPRPGFDLEGLVIYDDPAFSAEPMMRAQEVSAAIRFRSLLRGRLEIAALSATEPSINLVRNHEGRWNLASLIERNAHIPAAPTQKSPSERRPAFPYLEASSARINFKIGQTKKSYALMDADVALWQDSENSWEARIKAAPVRTDFNLTDTGLLQINAVWQRAASLQSTPLQVTAQWQKGQLGQLTKLFSAKDRGWRGGVNVTAKLSGTPQALKIESHTTIDDFHRYDIVGNDSLRLATDCSGIYSVVTRFIDDLQCESPVSGGTLRLHGGVMLSTQRPDYRLTLSATKVPLTSLVRLLRQAKKQIPSDLTATGLVNAEFLLRNNYQSGLDSSVDGRLDCLPLWSGTGSATGVRLLSNAGKNEVAFATIPLALVGDSPCALQPGKRSRPKTQAQQNEPEPKQPHLRIGPITIATNSSEPVHAGGWLSTSGYRLFLRGDMQLEDLFRLEDALALPVGRPAAEGAATLDVSVSGPWQGFVPPLALGTAQLRNLRAEVRGLNAPIEIDSATITLTPDAMRMLKISARTGSTHWSGAVTAPRHCVSPGCAFQFDLTADQLSTGDLSEWFTAHPAKRRWYRILNFEEAQGVSPLLAVQARGHLRVGRFALNRVSVTQLATQVEVDRGKITLNSLRGQLLQGTHRGNWVIDTSTDDASTRPVRYRGTGTFESLSLGQMSALMNNSWIAGTADASFDVEGYGNSFRVLQALSSGKLQFAMRNGSLPHIEIPGSAGPLPVHRFTGELRLQKGVWELSTGLLESRDGIYRVSGSASPSGGIDFVLTRGDDRSWTLTGTLARPHIATVGNMKADAKAKTKGEDEDSP